MLSFRTLVVSAGLVVASTPQVFAADVAEKAAAILKQNCTGCHGAAMKMSKLDLRSREAMLAGGERGPAVEPGKSGTSRLYRFVSGAEKPTMPPGKALAPDEVETLRQWIDAGALVNATSKQDGEAE